MFGSSDSILFPKRNDSRNNNESRLMVTAVATTTITAWLVYVVTYKVIWYKGRKKADTIANNARKLISDGALIDAENNDVILAKVLNVAVKRARKWKTYQRMSDASPMTAQVGGISLKRVKRCVLSLPPEYALKPLHEDNRGIREVAFYEALKYACSEQHNNNKANNNSDDSNIASLWHSVFVWDDRSISANELALVASIKRMKREVQILRKLATFTPSYYGVVGQDENKLAVISPDAFLMLSDLTVNFSKPCVLDLKMGCTSYEPDASQHKKQHELSKYAKQSTFGFRIVGMRVYDPTHPQSDPKDGFRVFDKTYGRSLNTFPQVLNAFKLFFKQPCLDNVDQIVQGLLSKRTNTASTSSSSEQEDPNNNISVSKYDVDQLRNKLNAGCDDQTCTRSRVITNLTPQLLSIKKCFENENDMLSFISSSILIVYEGDITSENPDRAHLRMIDFGHVRRQAGGDLSYLHGVKQVLNIFSTLQQKQSSNHLDDHRILPCNNCEAASTAHATGST